VVLYRQFRNTDPPELNKVWNEVCTGRGAIRLLAPAPFDLFVLAKPYFDPAGLIVAMEGKECLGFAHGGFGPDPSERELAHETGVVCFVGVLPAHRRRGIGTQLLGRCEHYLKQKGARVIYAGCHWPLTPFYLGIYGGSDAPGFLASDAGHETFFPRRGYQAHKRFLVLQRRLVPLPKIVDARLPALRQRFQLQVGARKSLGSWWRECVFGLLEPVEFFLVDQQTGATPARALIWHMEQFSFRWNCPALGILDFEVAAECRRQGIGKFLFQQMLRQIQEQFQDFFELAEIHVPEANAPARAFLQALGFERVDVGTVYEMTS